MTIDVGVRLTIAQALERLMKDGMPFRFEAYDGSVAGPEDAQYTFRLLNERGLAYLMTAPGDLGFGRAIVAGDLEVDGVSLGNPYDVLAHVKARLSLRMPPPAEVVQIVRSLGVGNLKPPPPPPEEHLPRWRRAFEGLRHSKARDAEAIHHHYDVSNRFYEFVLGPSMTYTCAVFPREDATLEEAQFEKYDLVARKLDLKEGDRLLDVGCGWGGMVRHAAKHYGVKVIGVTLSEQQALWAQDEIKRQGLDHLAEVRFGDYRDVVETGFDAVSSIGLTEHIGVRNYASYFSFLGEQAQGRRAAAQPLHHPARRFDVAQDGCLHRPVRVPRRRARPGRPHRLGRARQRPGGAPRRGPARALRPDPQGVEREPRGALGRVPRGGQPRHGQGVGHLHGRLTAGVRAQRARPPSRAGRQGRAGRRRALPAASHLGQLT